MSPQKRLRLLLLLLLLLLLPLLLLSLLLLLLLLLVVLLLLLQVGLAVFKTCDPSRDRVVARHQLLQHRHHCKIGWCCGNARADAQTLGQCLRPVLRSQAGQLLPLARLPHLKGPPRLPPHPAGRARLPLRGIAGRPCPERKRRPIVCARNLRDFLHVLVVSPAAA